MIEVLQTPLTVLHVLACIILILVVLLQPGKGGGMGAFGGGGAQQVFGGRGASNVLTKATWVTAGVFFLSSVTLAYMSTSVDDSLQEKAEAEAEQKPTEPDSVKADEKPDDEPAPE